MVPCSSLLCSQEPATVPRPEPDEAAGQSLVSCPRLLIQCIHSYPSCLETLPFIHNLKDVQCHVMGAYMT